MHIEIYRYEDYLQYPLNRTSALRKFYGPPVRVRPLPNGHLVRIPHEALPPRTVFLVIFFLVHEMAHAWHAMLDYENEYLLENFSRVNETGIYEGVPGIKGKAFFILKMILSFDS